MNTILAMEEIKKYSKLNEKLKEDLYFLTQFNKPFFEAMIFYLDFWYNILYPNKSK